MNNYSGRKKKNIGIFFLELIFALILLATIAFSAIFLYFRQYLGIAYDSYVDGISINRIDCNLVPYVYDEDYNIINTYYGYFDNEEEGFIPTYSSTYTKLGTLPSYVYNAFVAIEDETFYENYGFSVKRLIAAVLNYELKGDSTFGASTITQQLIKIATGDTSYSAERKSKEIGASLYLTQYWDKFKILESYINLAYYGDGSYGIYEASMNYFGKAPENLNLAEAATLAAIINSPEYYCPYNGIESLNALIDRKNLVLGKMLELNFITEDSYYEALYFDITFMDKDYEYRDKAIDQYLSVAMAEAKEIVMNYYGLSSINEAFEKIIDGNTKIYTNLNTTLQQEAYNTLKYSFIGDIETGYILATKDGRATVAVTSRTDNGIDHVYSMTRQTGSAIKPLAAFGPAFDLNLSSPSSIEIDEPVIVDNWQIYNHTNTYSGSMSIKDALAYSCNTIAVKLLQKVGLYTSMDYLKRLGITSLSEDDLYYPALALGGLSQGISPFEMCQAYNAINNDGVFSKISFISKIEINGITIYPEQNIQRVFSSNANEMLKECLKAVVEYGTATKAKLDNHTVYAKTGTTTNSTDIWTCGFTDDATAVIWTGYDIPSNVNLSSEDLSEIWSILMNQYYLNELLEY